MMDKETLKQAFQLVIEAMRTHPRFCEEMEEAVNRVKAVHESNTQARRNKAKLSTFQSGVLRDIDKETLF